MGPESCPETSVKDYHSTLRNNPEERSSHQHRGGNLKLLECVNSFRTSRVLTARLTFSRVASNIFNTFSADFLLRTKLCVLSHVPNGRRHITVSSTGHFRTV
jgi:hypothetical protein